VDSGVFLQANRQLVDWLEAAGGIRFDYVSNVNRGGFFGDHTVSNGNWSGFAAATVGPFSNVEFTAQVARGFRDPTLSDRFFRGPTGRGFITGNPDLVPETSLQFDLGARYTAGRLRFGVFYYHYTINDLIERYQTEPDFFFFRNRGEAEIQGFEVEVQAALGRGFSVEAGGQIGRGAHVDDGTDLDDISTDTVTATLRKTFGQKISTFARAAWYAEDDRPGPSEIIAPGHTNLDIGGSWLIHRNFEILGAVRNILNEDYYASPDPRFVMAPGINGYVTLKVRF
jgi:outer membrane receptor protein involved in Fe transport